MSNLLSESRITLLTLWIANPFFSSVHPAVCGRERDVHVHDFDVTLNRRIGFVNDISEVRFAKRDLLVISALSGEVSILKLKK